MKAFGFNEIALNSLPLRCAFPFKFGGQTRTAPICECVSFKIADVRHRLVAVDAPKTGKGEVPPFAVAVLPIQGRFPAVLSHRHPAEGAPEFASTIAVILDATEVFITHHQTQL